MNLEYFKTDKLTFRSIEKETLHFFDEYQKFMEKNPQHKCTFEDFMIVLSNYLNKHGYTLRKITKYFKQINNNIHTLAKTAVLNKKEEIKNDED